MLNYGDYAVTGSTAGGTDYYVNAPVTLNGSAATLSINGNAYTLIHNMTDFANINSNSSGSYALGNNIASTTTYTSSVVGNFFGVLAGMGHAISDLNIIATTQYIGLFRYNAGTIRNFGVVNGSVQSADAMVGGLVGVNTGHISDVFYIGLVSSAGGNGVGGVTAWNNGGSIKDSYSTGSVTGHDAIGGIAGYNENSGVVQRNYSTATIASLSAGRLGGIVGANNSGTVSDSYATSLIVGSGSFTGGGVLTSSQMKTAASFSGWDIATTGGSNSKWRIYNGETAPLLRSFLTPVTATASSATSTYSGSTFSGGSGVSYSDAGATLLGSVSYGGTSQGARNAGTYTLTANGLYSNQLGYDIKSVDGTLTINKASLTLNATSDSKTYDGSTYSSGTVSSSGLQAGDSLTATSQVYDNKNAGSRTLNVATYTVNDGNSGNNYNVVSNTAAGSISQANITLSSSDVSKTYDGTTTATGNAIATSGTLFTGDTLSGGAYAYTNKNAGTAKTVTVSGITVNDGNSGNNYNVVTNTAIGSIDQKTIHVSGANVADKVYDGTRTATINSLTVNGLITGDDVTTTADASFDTKDAGTNKSVRVSGIALAGADQSNYWMATEFLDTTASITAAAVPSANNTPYDMPAYRGVLQSGVGARFGEQPVLPGSSGANVPVQYVALNTAGNQVMQGQAITERIAGLGCVVQMPEDAPIGNCP